MFDVSIFEIAIGGFLIGGIYALMALGLGIVFGVSRIFNIAHGDFLMLGGVTCYWAILMFGVNPFVTPALLLPLFFGVGVLLYKGVIGKVATKTGEAALGVIIVTLGLAFVIEDSTSFGLAQFGISFMGVGYRLASVSIGSFSLPISPVRLISLLIIVILAVVLNLFLKKTLTGKIIRATMQDHEGAMAIGVNTERVSMITFGIGIALAAMAGLFIVMITSVTAFVGLPLTLKALTIIILGGLGSLPGSVIGAIILGEVESFTAFYAGTQWSEPMALFILIVVLCVRPQGLLGRKMA